MKRLAATIGVATLAWIGATAPAGAQASGDIDVSISPGRAEVQLGESTDLSVTVVNRGDQDSASLVVHIDITNLDRTGSVDPEDWTETLSQGIGTVSAGASKTVDWTVQPIAGGDFALYAVALTADGSDVVASNVLNIGVAEQRSLNPQGILPVALAVPIGVGGLLLAQRWDVRRKRHPALA